MTQTRRDHYLAPATGDDSNVSSKPPSTLSAPCAGCRGSATPAPRSTSSPASWPKPSAGSQGRSPTPATRTTRGPRSPIFSALPAPAPGSATPAGASAIAHPSTPTDDSTTKEGRPQSAPDPHSPSPIDPSRTAFAVGRELLQRANGWGHFCAHQSPLPFVEQRQGPAEEPAQVLVADLHNCHCRPRDQLRRGP